MGIGVFSGITGSGDGSGGGGGGGGGGISGSASLTFGLISDGNVSAQTFTIAGVAAGGKVIPGWPAALTSGLVGTMLTTASNTVEVRIANLSGGDVTLGALTYGANVR
jgi:hypothetical protein